MSASTYLRYEQVQASSYYNDLLQTAIERLTAIGAFSKEELLRAHDLVVFEGAIRWDYVVKMIEHAVDTELIAVASVFFRRHDREVERRFPERFAAIGHGKRTAGWVIATKENSHFVVHTLNNKRKRTIGTAKAANKTYRAGRKAGVLLPGAEYPIARLSDNSAGETDSGL